MDYFDPDRPDFSPYGFTCVRWAATVMPRWDRHNEVELNLLEGGRLVYLMGGRKVAVEAGRLTAFWAGVPHQVIELDGVAEYFVMTIPLAWFLQWQLPGHFQRAILNAATVAEPDAGRLPSDQARFETWVDDARVGSEERRRASLLEIEARLRRLAMDVPSDAPRGRRRTSTAVLDGSELSRAERSAPCNG